MLSKNKIKLIRSLRHKKYRQLHKIFMVEGEKSIHEVNHSGLHIRFLIGTPEFIHRLKNGISGGIEIIEVSENELSKISFLTAPTGGIALVDIPVHTIDDDQIANNLTLVLDDIQDPGNFGTIIRIADWFGIHNIFCSKETADIYNPKVIQATMGSFCRVKIHYRDLKETIKYYSITYKLPVFGAFLSGANIYDETLSENGLIVLGNESRGISDALQPLIPYKLYIPPFEQTSPGAESLNVSVATAIVCAEFRRRMIGNKK